MVVTVFPSVVKASVVSTVMAGGSLPHPVMVKGLPVLLFSESCEFSNLTPGSIYTIRKEQDCI